MTNKILMCGLVLMMAATPVAVMGQTAPSAASVQEAQSCGSAQKLDALLKAAVISGAQTDKDALAREMFHVSGCLSEKGLLVRSGLKGVYAPVLEIISVLHGRTIVLVSENRIAVLAAKLPKGKKKKQPCGEVCAK